MSTTLETKKPSGPWSVTTSLGVMILALLTYLTVTLVVGSAAGSPVVGAAAGALAGLAVFLIHRRLDSRAIRPSDAHSVIRRPMFWAAVALAFVLCWFSGQTSALWLASEVGSPNWEAHNQARHSADPTLLGLVTVVLAPLGEEALVRGIFFDRLRRHMPLILAALGSATIFSGLHGNIVQAAATLPIGVLLALVYQATGRLWAPMVVHAMFNLMAVMVPAAIVTALVNPVVVVVMLLAAGSAIVAVLLMIEQSQTRQAPEVDTTGN